MAETDNQRRLAAILAADVVGYSKMMGRDEAGTLAALRRHRADVFDPAVANHGGRVFKLIGDGTLVEFPSVVDAVNCAVEIQSRIRDLGAPDGVTLRIGINLGDIILEGDDVYGDGVNVAARLEPLAEPGGICVASIVNESVGHRVDIAFRDGGETRVKNIERPIRIWRWHPGDGMAPKPAPSAADTTTPATPADNPKPAPSIAVLPFDNMSGDAEQEYFSDGITEDIITDLSKVSGLTVIARNSSFAYKGTSPDIRTVGRDLGVTNVLEGSIRRAGNRVRITAQLIDASTGGHLWAERYDRDLTDIFAVQDEVTTNIVDALKIALAPGEAARIAEVPTQSVEAHDLFLRARELFNSPNRTYEMYKEAMPLLERCIEIDPDYAEPYAGLAMLHNLDSQNGWTHDPEAFDKAAQLTAIAEQKGPDVPFVLYMAGLVAFWKRDFATVHRKAARLLTINPSFSLAYAIVALTDIYRGHPLEAIPIIERGIRLDPALAHQTLHFLATAFLVAGKYEAAAATFRERIRLVPDTDLSRGLLVATLGLMGEVGEGRKVLAELRELRPNYSFDAHLARLPFENAGDVERIREGYARVADDD